MQTYYTERTHTVTTERELRATLRKLKLSDWITINQFTATMIPKGNKTVFSLCSGPGQVVYTTSSIHSLPMDKIYADIADIILKPSDMVEAQQLEPGQTIYNPEQDRQFTVINVAGDSVRGYFGGPDIAMKIPQLLNGEDLKDYVLQ